MLYSDFKKYQFKPTIFLCSSIVGTNSHFWWTNIENNEEKQKLKKLDDKEVKDFSNVYQTDLNSLVSWYKLNVYKDSDGNKQIRTKDLIEGTNFTTTPTTLTTYNTSGGTSMVGKSPGFISCLKLPTAVVAIICVHPSCFNA